MMRVVCCCRSGDAGGRFMAHVTGGNVLIDWVCRERVCVFRSSGVMWMKVAIGSLFSDRYV